MLGLVDAIIRSPGDLFSPDCKRCCRILRKLLKELRLTSENDVIRDALDDSGDRDGRALASGKDSGSEEVEGTALSSSRSSPWEGMSWRSSLPFLLEVIRGVAAALLRKWPS